MKWLVFEYAPVVQPFSVPCLQYLDKTLSIQLFSAIAFWPGLELPVTNTRWHLVQPLMYP